MSFVSVYMYLCCFSLKSHDNIFLLEETESWKWFKAQRPARKLVYFVTLCKSPREWDCCLVIAPWELKVLIIPAKWVAHLQCARFFSNMYNLYCPRIHQRRGKQIWLSFLGGIYNREEGVVLTNHIN